MKEKVRPTESTNASTHSATLLGKFSSHGTTKVLAFLCNVFVYILCLTMAILSVHYNLNATSASEKLNAETIEVLDNACIESFGYFAFEADETETLLNTDSALSREMAVALNSSHTLYPNTIELLKMFSNETCRGASLKEGWFED